MAAIVTNDIRVYNSLQFLESVSETANSSLYTFIGQPATIPASAATDNVILQYSIWDGMIALKRINGSADIRSGIRKIMWTSGNVYPRYDANNPNIHLLNFYVINPDDNSVYKCIANANGGASTVAPTRVAATTIGNVFLSDNYKWKYMYTIDSGDLAKFGTPSFVPITANATVASQAVEGSILHINVESGGNYAGTPTVVINGDGTGATATVNKSGTAIANVVITSIGSGYRFANITLSGGTPTTQANLRASISPPGGHGKNALNELGSHYVILNTRIETTDTKFPVGITYHQVGLVQDPTNTSGDVLYTSTLKAYQTLGFSTPPTVSQGNIVFQSNSGANAYVVGTVTGDASNVIIIRRNNLTSNIASNYASFLTGGANTAFIGATSLGVVQTVVPREVALNSGKIIYVDNRAPISRVVNQAESISIILEF